MNPTEADRLHRERDLVRRLLDGDRPGGPDFDACRAVLQAEPAAETRFRALCMLLEGALADPGLAIDDAQLVVPLLKGLARGDISPDDIA